MYSFGNRQDTCIIDEPLYPHFLLETGAQRPDRAETLQHHDTDWSNVVRNQILGDYNTDYLFVKHMPHHMIGVDNDSFINELTHVFLIRSPKQMIASYIKQVPNPTMIDMGLKMQWELFERLRGNGGNPVVIDSKQLLLNPEKVLKELCSKIEIPFDSAMLQWKAGPRKEDGIWARYWYHSVHQSTGFVSYKEKNEPVPERLVTLLADCKYYYNKLIPYTLKA